MKKRTIRLLALMLSLICVLSACGTNQTNSKNESPKNKTEENSIEDNKNVYGDSGNSGDSPSLAPGSRIYCRSMDEYLEAKNSSGFSVEEGWIPWEQFSFLGDFKKSYWIKGSAGMAQYEYLYIDPNTGKTIVYYVSYKQLPKDAGIKTMTDFMKASYGEENFFEDQIVYRTASSFADPDLTKNPGRTDKGTFLIDDIMHCVQLEDGKLNGYITFLYNGYWVEFLKKTLNGNGAVPFDLAEDHEIIRRLTNTETYMDAIKELMDPQNAQTAK